MLLVPIGLILVGITVFVPAAGRRHDHGRWTASTFVMSAAGCALVTTGVLMLAVVNFGPYGD